MPDGGEVGGVAVGVGGARRVQDERAHVAEVGHPAEQAHRVDEPLGRRLPAVQRDAQHRPGPAGQVARGEGGGRAARQARVADRGHLRPPGEPAGQGQRVRAVLPHPQRQGLQPLLEQEGVERGDGRAEPGGDDRAGVGDVGALAVGLPPAAPAEQRRRLARGRGRGRDAVTTCSATTTAPPSEAPWPARNLLAECTTTSAPCSIGRSRYGVVRVESTTSGTPCAWATDGHPGDVEDHVGGVAHRLARTARGWSGAAGRATRRGRPGRRRSRPRCRTGRSSPGTARATPRTPVRPTAGGPRRAGATAGPR